MKYLYTFLFLATVCGSRH